MNINTEKYNQMQPEVKMQYKTRFVHFHPQVRIHVTIAQIMKNIQWKFIYIRVISALLYNVINKIDD